MIELLQTIFWTVSIAGKLISILVFKAGALLISLVSMVLQIPWAGVLEVLNLLITAVRSAAEWFVESFVHWFLSFVVKLFGLIPEVTSGLVSLASNATEIVEENMQRGKALVEIVPYVFRSVAGTARSVTEALVYSYSLAAYYVTGNR